MVSYSFPATLISTTGLATSAKQDEQTVLLTNIDAGTPAALGQTTMAASTPVTIASNQSAVPVSGPLTDTQLRATTVPVSGPLTDTQLRAVAVPVSGAFFQGTQPVSAASLPLPTGAATETTLAALNTKVTAVNTGAVVVSSSALPSGASTETTLAALNTKVTAVNTGAVTISTALPTGANTIGSLTANQSVNTAQINAVAPLMGNGVTGTGSLRVTLASDTSSNTNAFLVQAARAPTSTLSNVASSATTVTLLALNTNRKMATIYNDSTALLYLKWGATASATSHTVQIQSGGYYELPGPNVYTGVIDGIWASATGFARVTELV